MTDTSPEAIAALCERLRGEWIPPTFELWRAAETVEKLQAERDAAVGYATRLAESLVSKYYPDNTGWQPLPDILGLLTQIDNATTGIADFGARQERAAIVADLLTRSKQMRPIIAGPIVRLALLYEGGEHIKEIGQ